MRLPAGSPDVRVIQRGNPELVGRPLARYDLAELMTRGVPEPELAADGLLYRGAVHSLAGEPEAGKTTLAAWWMRNLLEHGEAVVYLDEESGPELMAEKLDAVGITVSQVARLLHYYPFPSRSWDQADLAGLNAVLADVRPGLLVADSTSAFMAAADKDENWSRDVRRFVQQVLLEPARSYRLAAVITDHLSKSNGGGRYARGSGDKLAVVDVGYRLESITPFDRERSGLVKLVCTKDRRGYIGRGRAWEVQVLTGGGGIELSTTVAAAPLAITDGLSPAARKVLEALEAAEGLLTVKQIGDQVAAKHPPGLKRNTISAALTDLSEAGWVDQAEHGPRGLNYWMVAER
jgi:hypothetical protein